MNKQISWDQSLIKKYSSSNHFKLLNQLRNEVIKYPLKKKKNIQSSIAKDNKLEGNDNLTKETTQDMNVFKNYTNTKETESKNSNISFNNTKNFSIYNNSNIDSSNDQKDNDLSSQKKFHNDCLSSTFNERLNKIDLK